MNNSVCFLVILFGAFALSTAEEFTNSSLQVVDNVNNFLRDNPGVTLTKLDAVRTPQGFKYLLGQRRDGDKIVGNVYENTATYETPQDMTLMVKYPTIGTKGCVVTYVKVLLYHLYPGHPAGNAYVIDGGIGQRSISVLVEALNVTYMYYWVDIYGL